MRVAIYGRVSTFKQVEEGSSLEAQQRACEDWSRSNRHVVMGLYLDEGKSAKESSIRKRPRLIEMLEDAKAKNFDLLVIHKLDRLSRSLRDTLSIMSALDSYGVRLVSVSEQFDFSSPIGKVLFTLLISFAQFYLDNLSGEVRKGNLERAMQGYWHGKTPPVGYRYDKEARILVAHDKERLLVHRAFELASLNQVSLEEICGMLKKEKLGIYKGDEIVAYLYPITLRYMLHNRIYAGDVVIGEKGNRFRSWFDKVATVYPGKHEPLVTLEKFMKVNDVLKARSTSGRGIHRKARPHILGAGFLRCAHCGTILSPGGGGNSYKRGMEARLFGYICKSGKYGRECKASRKSVGSHIIMVEVDNFINSIELDTTSRERVRQNALKNTQADVNADKRQSLERRRERLRDIYASDGYTSDEWHKLDKKVVDEINELPVLQVTSTQLLQAEQVITDVKPLWAKATDMEKRELLRLMFINMVFDLDERKIKTIKPQPAFAALFSVSADGLIHVV